MPRLARVHTGAGPSAPFFSALLRPDPGIFPLGPANPPFFLRFFPGPSII